MVSCPQSSKQQFENDHFERPSLCEGFLLGFDLSKIICIGFMVDFLPTKYHSRGPLPIDLFFVFFETYFNTLKLYPPNFKYSSPSISVLLNCNYCLTKIHCILLGSQHSLCRLLCTSITKRLAYLCWLLT